MNVAGCRHAEPTLQRPADVGDDVAEQVVGDDHLELSRVLHEQHCQRVDVEMRRLDLRIVGAHFLEHPLPQRVTVGHRVALVGHRH
jgi:hypothetical protein